MRITERIKELVHLGVVIIHKNGLVFFIKQALLYAYSSFCSCSKIIIFQKDVDTVGLESITIKEPENIYVCIIDHDEDIENLKREGYRFDYYTKLDIDKKWLTRGALLVVAFIDKELTHKSWIAETESAAILLAPYIKSKQIGFRPGDLVIEETSTNPLFRRQGLYLYVYAYIFNYARKKRLNRVVYSAQKNNLPVIKAQEKLRANIYKQGYHIRILWFWDFYILGDISQNKVSRTI